MKVLWLTNYPLPRFSDKIGKKSIVNEGWLVGLSEFLRNQKGSSVIFCTCSPKFKGIYKIIDDNSTYYGIEDANPNKYNKKLKSKFSRILLNEKPDIIHIMGTEFPHSLSLYEAAQDAGFENRCVVSIQGLVSKCAEAYDIGIEEEYHKSRFFWDMLMRDSIDIGKKDYEKRGLYEKQLLSNIPNVIGSTEWDRNAAYELNHSVRYFKCNEMLRKTFYLHKWSSDECEPYTIMISQATYAIKGFHLLLKAIMLVKDKYPGIRILVPSNTTYVRARNRCGFLNSDYSNYVCKLISDGKLWGNIEFLGSLNEEAMCKVYLRSSLFIMCSTIENSSNSLCEAMLLGMPIVSSRVGGLTSLMEDKSEGIFYTVDNYSELADDIEYVFSHREEANAMGRNARERALLTHNKKEILEQLTKVYDEIHANVMNDEINR